MRSTLRHYVACLLLVLLPLQALASVAACCGVTTQAANDDGHCNHASAVADRDVAGGNMAADPDQDSTCATVCAMGASALLPALQSFAAEPAAVDADSFSEFRYLSFIPKGPQRPPALLA